MWALLTTTVLCVSQLGYARLPPDGYRDVMREILEAKYRVTEREAGPEAGEPLLLTEYINNNQTAQAREAARVDPQLMLGVESYAGYLTVNPEYNSNMWFWYFPVAGQPVKDTPWIMWLQGGPGVSSLFGLFTEIGPFAVNEDEELEKIQYSWGMNHSLLFFDNPVGTGYSFTEKLGGFCTNQAMVGENLYTALQQFLTIFPELRTAPLTIAGESYAGKHIPSIGINIHRNKEQQPLINLHGLAIGNGFIDPQTLKGYSEFAREIGVLDDEQADEMQDLEANITQYFKESDTDSARQDFLKIIYMYRMSGLSVYNYLSDNNDRAIFEEPFVSFIQRNEVRRALHVGHTSFHGLLQVYYMLGKDFMKSERPHLEELLENYNVMLYNGHLDFIVGYRPSVNTYNALNFTGATAYKESDRKAWYHNGNIAGYYKTGGLLTEVMVRGAGHMVPGDKPSAALGLISAFARGITLDDDTAYLDED